MDERQYVTFSLKGLKTITNNQYEPACGILSLLDILFVLVNSSDQTQKSLRNEMFQTLKQTWWKRQRHVFLIRPVRFDQSWENLVDSIKYEKQLQYGMSLTHPS